MENTQNDSGNLFVAQVKYDPIRLSKVAITLQHELFSAAMSIVSVESAEQQNAAVAVARDIQAAINAAEKDRKAVKKPVQNMGDAIDDCAKGFVAPLKAEKDRIGQLISAYVQAEQIRVAEEQRRRQEEIRKAEEAQRHAEEERRKAEATIQTMADLQKALEAERKANEAAAAFRQVVVAPSPEVAKAKGASTRVEACYEVVDIHALYAALPAWVNLEPNRAIIRASLSEACLDKDGNSKIPGLRIWIEHKTTFRS